MNQSELSHKFLLDLYLGKPTHIQQPILQILAFQISENNPKEIIIRLSDGLNFFDATLLGPYDVLNNKILVSSFSGYHGTALEFKKFDVIKVVDFFSKLDDTKICQLKMMIRKIVEVRICDKKINKPQQLSFYAQINQLLETNRNINTQKNVQRSRVTGQQIDNYHRAEMVPQVQVKISEDQINYVDHTKKIEKNEKNEKKMSVINKQLQILGICKDRNPDDPMTCRDVINGFDGFFIGKLMRMKMTVKEGKDSSTNMLALGFVDLNGDLMKLNLLGKMALREQKELKLGKCYYIKGLEYVNNKGSNYIRLREKDYKLHVLNEQSITSKFPEEYYHWEHEYDYIESENVDVIGIIQDIQEKTVYGLKEVGEHKETKEVIRVVIRNKFKTVKVSFWSDQLRNLSKLNLKKGEVVVIEDVRKKKVVFLDFANESTVIRLLPQSQLYKKLGHLLPQNIEYPNPINIDQLYKIQQLDKYNTKAHHLRVYLLKIQEDKIVFKMCDLCKKKININSQKCFDCKSSVMSYKYNTNVEFSDYSSSIWVSVYDSMAEKLFGVSALRFKEIKQNEEEYEQFINHLYFRPFQVGVEIKNQKFILRSIDMLKDEDFVEWCHDSITNISKFTEKSQKPKLEQRCKLD